jgi:hypothetical protein
LISARKTLFSGCYRFIFSHYYHNVEEKRYHQKKAVKKQQDRQMFHGKKQQNFEKITNESNTC